MEIEVKERLCDERDYECLRTTLGRNPIETERQRNVFFDDTKATLAKDRSSLRLRFLQSNKEGEEERCLLTCKEGSRITSGVSSAKETQEYVISKSARTFCEDPSSSSSFTALNSMVAVEMIKRHNVNSNELHCTGSFRTIRESYKLPGSKEEVGIELILEVDKTDFGFAVIYEVECEAPDEEKAQKARTLLCRLLDSCGISHKASTKTKLAILATHSVE